MGMGHGHYVFKDTETGEEVFQWMRRSKNTAYTEFGISSPSTRKVLEKIIPDNELFPPKPGTSWETHHAFNAWDGDTWLRWDMLQDYFGPFQNLETLIEKGQWLQAEGYKFIFEEARRQKPYCSMALNWCFNEPWPTAANNSLINYPDIPKLAYHAVAEACRPVMASAGINKFKWHPGELFECDIWLLNDKLEEWPAGVVSVYIDGENSMHLLDWQHPAIKPNQNVAGPTAKILLPSWNVDRITLRIESSMHPGWNSSYTLAYQEKDISRKEKNSTALNR
jgi:beta-mannosidase